MRKPVQLSLFGNFQSFNIEPDISEAMAKAVNESGLSRTQVVDELSRVGRKFGVNLTKGSGLSVATLEKWLNPNAEGHFPSVKALLVFCAVMKGWSLRILNMLVAPLGYMVIGQRDAKLLEWARNYHEVKAAQKRMRRLSEDMED